jgi:arylsulfatase A-like enzyme
MDDKPPFYQTVHEGWYGDDEGNPLQDDQRIASLFPYKFGEYTADAVRAYIGMVNMLDTYIGKVLDYLDRSGQADNTLIVFTSDHGEMLGNHGLWEKGICAYDDAQRVPVILERFTIEMS